MALYMGDYRLGDWEMAILLNLLDYFQRLSLVPFADYRNHLLF